LKAVKVGKLWGPALEKEILAGMPLENSLFKKPLQRCFRKFWGPALQKRSLAGRHPKSFVGHCFKKFWGPLEKGSSLGRCFRKFWGPAPENGSLGGMAQKLSRTLL